MNTRIDTIVSFILMLLLAAGAWFTTGVWRDFLLMLIAAPVSFLYSLFLSRFQSPVGLSVRSLLLTTTATVFFLSTLVLAYMHYIRERERAPFPALGNAAIRDGLIADFAPEQGYLPDNAKDEYDVNFVKTALGTRCSLFSDSETNQDSKIWYEWRRATTGDPEGGFLRIHYILRPIRSHEPFVGIYCLLSPPPGTLYDVSRFVSLSYKVRDAMPQTAEHIRMSSILYSTGLEPWQEKMYAYPTLEVPANLLSANWQIVTAPFNEFHAPLFMGSQAQIRLDTHSVFQFGFIIVGLRNANGIYPFLVGALDIDDIHFQ